MKSEREIEMLIRKTNQEIKKIKPTIKSMGSPEARTVKRLEGRVEAFKEVIGEEKKDDVEIGVVTDEHGTHTIITECDSVVASGTVDINHIDPILTTSTNTEAPDHTTLKNRPQN